MKKGHNVKIVRDHRKSLKSIKCDNFKSRGFMKMHGNEIS